MGSSFSDVPGDEIKTFALGSCVVRVIFDRSFGIAGLMQFALPDSSIYPGKAESRPGFIVDTGEVTIASADKRWTL